MNLLVIRMKRLILSRHGETDWNKERKIMGWKPVSINSKGITQAKKLGKYIQKSYTVDKIIASDLQRTKETVEIIQQNLSQYSNKIEYISEIRDPLLSAIDEATLKGNNLNTQ